MTTVLKNKDVYHVNNAIKLGQYNVGREGDILTIPLYMGFLVNDKLADVIIPDVDVSLLNVKRKQEHGDEIKQLFHDEYFVWKGLNDFQQGI